MKIKFTSLLIILTALISSPAFTQEAPVSALDTLSRTVEGIVQSLDVKSRLKLSGYVQAQYQVADSAGQGGFAGGDFAQGVDKRFAIRRGRIKFQYDGAANEKGWSTSQYVLQFDVSQSGLTIKDAYAKFTDPWTGWFSVTAGMQNRPFGFEIGYSSSLRESPERGRMSQIIFPNERDLGAMLTIQGPKNSNWNWLKFEGGLFNGTGGPSAGANVTDFDKYKDFIGHLSANRNNKSEKIKWGLGASIYSGGFRQDVVDRYSFATDAAGTKGFGIEMKKSEVNPGISARKNVTRQYVGVDGQLNIDWLIGITALRAEFIQGEQPAVAGSSTSPAAAPSQTNISSTTTTVVTGIDSLGNPITANITTSTSSTGPSDLYVRNFNGAYFYFIQNIGQSPFQAIVKYDWYDPNTDVEGDEIGKAVTGTGFKTTNAADIKYTTIGLGLAYRWDANLKITAYYDMIKNETSKNLSLYTVDKNDDLVTVRVQVKF